MRLFTLDEAVDMTNEMFSSYVEHLGVSLMSGEVPSVLFAINRRGTKEKDWLAQVRFKNTLAISIFRCDVYLEDVFRLCRMCKIYLITKDIYKIVSLYAMLHPLYQSQYVDFGFDVNADYESMTAGSGKMSYQFILDYFEFSDPIQRVIADILKYHMMIFTNHHDGEKHVTDTLKRLQQQYETEMLEKYPGAYNIARYRKAQTSLIDEEGYLILERKTRGQTIYNTDSIDIQNSTTL